MNHESSSPRHAVKPTSHRWKTGANAENLSVDSIINRIARERQEVGGRHRKEKTVGRHAVAEVASIDSIPARRRPYSFEDSYRETLDALNASIERETGKKYSIEDEGRAMMAKLDAALPATNEPVVRDSEVSTATTSEPAINREPTVNADEFGPVNENLGAVGDEQLEITELYKNETLKSIDLFDKALPVDAEEPVVNTPVAFESTDDAESKPSLKERITRLFKRRDAARERVNLRAAARNGAETVRANVNTLKFNLSQLGRRIGNRFNKRRYYKDEDGEIITYNDGRSTLSFTLEGNNVLLGRDPKHPENQSKYAQDFTTNGSDMAMILTDKGRFGIGRGYIMDLKTGFYYDVLPNDKFDLTIGKNAKLPGVGNIGAVRAVELKYKNGSVDAGTRTEDASSPFSDFDQFINDIDAEEAKNALK